MWGVEMLQGVVNQVMTVVGQVMQVMGVVGKGVGQGMGVVQGVTEMDQL